MTWTPDGTRTLCRALTEPVCLPDLRGEEWTGLLAAARETSLLGAVWVRAEAAGVVDRLPVVAARHLRGGYRLAERNGEAIRWELEQLQAGFLCRLEPPVLLKGAAYLLGGLPNARGRVCNDIDLLFPPDQVERAETLLFFDGWSGTHHDAYDQRYYREWMHELPPLQHRRRGTTLDLHHNILPQTFTVRTDSDRLRTQALVPPWRYRLLVPPHLVLHAVVHLFSETEWDRGLRDLYDIHVLLEHFQDQLGEPFWRELVAEADALGIGWLLGHAVACTRRLFATPLPVWVQQELDGRGVGSPLRSWTRSAFRHGLNTRASATPVRDALARGALFLRGHWLKMPPRLLARHLAYKAFFAPGEEDTAPPGDAEARRHG